MAAVTILASALQNDSGTGAPVDVSAYSTLRLNWTALVDLGQYTTTYLRLIIETAATAAGPWREIYRRQQDANTGWDCAPRMVLVGFDALIRARWEGSYPRTLNEGAYYSSVGPQGPGAPTIPAVKKFTVGLAGEAT
jgi:hypothetical protein